MDEVTGCACGATTPDGHRSPCPLERAPTAADALALLRELAECDPVISVEGGEICGLCRRSEPEDRAVQHYDRCLRKRARLLLGLP